MVLSKMSFSAVNIGSFYESSKIFGHKLQKKLQFLIDITQKSRQTRAGHLLHPNKSPPTAGDTSRPRKALS